MLSSEYNEFYNAWIAKAAEYQGYDLRNAVDLFFTLFVIYNRLYVEATFQLVREGRIKLAKNKPIPDRKAATDYVMQFLDCNRAIDKFIDDPKSAAAIQAIITLLSDQTPGPRFAVKLDIYGQSQPDKDMELLCKLRSRNSNERGKAVLEFLYAVRCNLFHGQKDFVSVQLEIMCPACILLRHTTQILFDGLNEYLNT